MLMINHIALFVRDFEPMLKFYEEVLGFKRHHSFSVDPKNIQELFGIESSADAQVLEAGNIRIEFIKLSVLPEPANPKSIYGFHHIAIKVENPEVIIGRAKKHGSQITQTFHKDHMVYFLKDPEENSIEISIS